MAQTKQSAPKKTPAAKRSPAAPAKRAPRKNAKPAQKEAAVPTTLITDTASPRPRGKLGDLLAAVEAANGATLDELSTALGWQPHTARAAISRLRQRGFDIALTEVEGRKAYRIQQGGA